MLRFALVSPLRIEPADWAGFSKHISAAFKGSEKPPELDDTWTFSVGVDYKYHPIEREETTRGDPFAAPLEECLVAALSRVRKNTFAARPIREGSVLLIFSTGEACVVELHEAEASDAIAEIQNRREASPSLVEEAAGLLNSMLKAAKSKAEPGETITHTILLAEQDSSEFGDVARACFGAEGIENASSLSTRDTYFQPGWSYSVCISSQPKQLWDRVALMTRIQCEWYDVRTAQDFCLRRLAETDSNQSVSELINLERRIVQYQTEFRLWRHRMQEYRANLKPALTDSAQLVEAKWQTLAGKNNVHQTLGQARDLIQTAYSRRILVQERRQSLMIFVLTSLGILSIASIAATYWDWLTRANLTQEEFVASTAGQWSVIIALVGLLAILFLLIISFVRIRRKPE